MLSLPLTGRIVSQEGAFDRGRFIQGLLTGVAKNRGHLTGGGN